jgi:hypothetical protein
VASWVLGADGALTKGADVVFIVAAYVFARVAFAHGLELADAVPSEQVRIETLDGMEGTTICALDRNFGPQ